MRFLKMMIDLYQELAIKSTSTIITIEKAIRRCKSPKIVADATFVLLHADRKFVYDRDRSHLIQLSKLRLFLGLSSPNRMTPRFFRTAKPKTLINNYPDITINGFLKKFLAVSIPGCLLLLLYFKIL